VPTTGNLGSAIGALSIIKQVFTDGVVVALNQQRMAVVAVAVLIFRVGYITQVDVLYTLLQGKSPWLSGGFFPRAWRRVGKLVGGVEATKMQRRIRKPRWWLTSGTSLRSLPGCRCGFGITQVGYLEPEHRSLSRFLAFRNTGFSEPVVVFL